MSELVLWELMRGALATRALALAVDLGLPEALADGPKRIDDDVAYRLLRALASEGVFEEVEPRVFRNTEASELLRTSGWHDFARLFGGIWLRAVVDLDATGGASFPRVFGAEFWDWLSEHPDERAAFDRAMAQDKERGIERVAGVGWRGDELVVDVGGGDGAFLRLLLDRCPELRGIVFDLPATVRDESNFDERLQFVAGSFFESVPRGDVYVLGGILHDWDDEHASRILRTIRSSADDRARLILRENVIEPGNEPDGAKWLDVLMLTLAGGRERDEAQWQALLAAGGWESVSMEDGLIEAQCLAYGT
jgi:O-methyltransferase